METMLYEDDFLSVVFDDKKDEFCSNQSFYPTPKVSEFEDSYISLSPLREELCKVGRESGNPEEDEGFEDFVEEEITDALQKDCDPTLAGSSTFSEGCKPDQLDVFSMIGGETDDMLISRKPFMSPSFPEEILDFDQGVAMESDHPRHNIFTEGDDPLDLPFSSSLSTTMNVDSLSSSSFLSPPPPLTPQPPHLVSNCSFANASFVGQPTNIVAPSQQSTTRQNSELDLICSVIQSESQQSYSTFPQSVPPLHSNISIETNNGIDLINLLTSSAVVTNEFSPFTTEHSTNEVQPQGCNSVSQSPLNVADVSNLGNFSAKFPDAQYSTDCRQRTPTPSPFLPPSPVSSVTTECSESDFGKESKHASSKSNATDPVAKKIVNMPFYEFKKILDSPSVSERDKEQAKVIRKRGKNKMAAKHCRQRKVEVIMGLQLEIEKLKGFKASLVMKALHLQKKIEEDKRKVGNCYHSSQT